MTLKHVLKLFSKTEVQEDKTHPNHLSQTILNRLFGRVLKKEGVKVSCAKHTVNDLFSYSPIHLFTFKRVAFTLAEVLITLGIIGVVAALTLPTLIQNHQKQALKTQLQKVVNTLNNVMQLSVAQEGVSDFCGTTLYNIFARTSYDCLGKNTCSELDNELKKYLKYVAVDDNQHSYSFKYGNNMTGFSNYSHRMVLPDGSFLFFSNGQGYCAGCGHMLVYVDLNGEKGPNEAGKDFHRLSIAASETWCHSNAGFVNKYKIEDANECIDNWGKTKGGSYCSQ